MFQEMANRSEQLFFSPILESVEDNLFHLPAFLEALAAIVKEMREVCVCVCVVSDVPRMFQVVTILNHTSVPLLQSYFCLEVVSIPITTCQCGHIPVSVRGGSY